MGLSIRARELLWEQHREKTAKRQRAERRAEKLSAAFHAEYLARDRAAAALGISTHQLKRWTMAARGPTPTKMGTTRQSRTFWRASEIARYLADPAAYEAGKTSATTSG
jgi:hypothetical protein